MSNSLLTANFIISSSTHDSQQIALQASIDDCTAIQQAV